jgi:hypothetical protein
MPREERLRLESRHRQAQPCTVLRVPRNIRRILRRQAGRRWYRPPSTVRLCRDQVRRRVLRSPYRGREKRQVRGISPLALQHIGAIDAGGFNADEHLAQTRSRHRPRGKAEDFGPARTRGIDIAHSCGKGHGVRSSLGVRVRSEKGLKSVWVSKASMPSRRLSQPTQP